MRVMIICKASKDSEAGVMPKQEFMAEIHKFNEELMKAGVRLAVEGLYPSSQGKRVRVSGEKRVVIDGPFTESKELIASFWIWQVKSMEEAVEWVKRCPAPDTGEFEVEIRRVYSPEDFGPEFMDEVKRRDERLRDHAGTNKG